MSDKSDTRRSESGETFNGELDLRERIIELELENATANERIMVQQALLLKIKGRLKQDSAYIKCVLEGKQKDAFKRGFYDAEHGCFNPTLFEPWDRTYYQSGYSLGTQSEYAANLLRCYLTHGEMGDLSALHARDAEMQAKGMDEAIEKCAGLGHTDDCISMLRNLIAKRRKEGKS